MFYGKKLLLLLTSLPLAFCGCSKTEDLLTFTITDHAEITIDNGLPVSGLPFEIPTPDVSTNSEQEFENNDTRIDLVKDIRLDDLRLEITAPQGKTFSFLKSIHIYISTNQSDEILLAYLDNIPTEATLITLIPTTEKLDSYIKSSAYKLNVSAVARETLTHDTDVRADIKYKVTAAPL